MRSAGPQLETDTSRASFAREGWVLLPGLLCARTIESLRAASDAIEQGAASIERDTVVGGVRYEVQSRSGRRGEPAVARGALRKVLFASKLQAAFARLARDERLLHALTSIGVSSPQCLVDQLNFKLPRIGTGFPFHQDAAFLIGKTRGRIERHGGAHAFIALDPSDEENGAIEVLGRTHHGGIRSVAYDASGTNEGVFDETHRALLPMASGDVLLFHPLLAHGSGFNRSDRPRRAAALWYVGRG